MSVRGVVGGVLVLTLAVLLFLALRPDDAGTIVQSEVPPPLDGGGADPRPRGPLVAGAGEMPGAHGGPTVSEAATGVPPTAPPAVVPRSAARDVTVLVGDALGTPISGARVELLGLTSGSPEPVWASVGTFSTDDQGRVRTFGPVDRRLAVVTTSRLAGAPVGANAAIVSAGTTPVVLRFSHLATEGFGGRVVDADSGVPVAGVRVEFKLEWPPAGDTVGVAIRCSEWKVSVATGPDGEFRFDAISEPGELDVTAAGYWDELVEVTPAKLESGVTVRLRGRPGWLGTVRDEAGHALPGALVWIVGPKGAPEPPADDGPDSRDWAGASLVVDGGGRYLVDLRRDVLNRRPPGEYRLEAEAGGCSRAASDWMAIGPDTPPDGRLPALVLARGTGTVRVLVRLPTKMERAQLTQCYVVVRRRSGHRTTIGTCGLEAVRDGSIVEIPNIPDEPVLVGVQRVGSPEVQSASELRVPPGTVVQLEVEVTPPR